MQKYKIEARRAPGSPWVGVQTVGEDLVDFAAEQIIDLTEDGGSTEWRLRPEDPDKRHPKSRPEPAPALPRPSRWERLRWWGLMRFSRKARS